MDHKDDVATEGAVTSEETLKTKKPVYRRVWFWILAVVIFFAGWIILERTLDPAPDGMDRTVYIAGKEALEVVDKYLDYGNNEIISKENAAKKIGEVINKYSLNDGMIGKNRTAYISILSLQTRFSSDGSRETIISSRNSLAKHLGKDAW